MIELADWTVLATSRRLVRFEVATVEAVQLEGVTNESEMVAASLTVT